MDRITQKDLEYLTKRINEATNSPLTPYTRNGKEGKRESGFTANIDNYHLDYAYGGVKLVRMVNESGGITEISRDGFGTKRQLCSWMQAFLSGLGENEKCPDACFYGSSRTNCTLGKETATECKSPN